MADLATTLKDAAYTTVGLGLLGFQKAQVRRVELTKDLETRLEPVRQQLGSCFGTLHTAMPEPARQLFDQVVDSAVTTAKRTQGELRALLGTPAA